MKSQLDGADDSCDDDHYEILNFSHNNDSNMECERISLPQENSEKDDPCQVWKILKYPLDFILCT